MINNPYCWRRRIAFFVVIFARRGPRSAWVSYGAAVIWALIAVYLEQSSTSMLIGLTTVTGIVLLIVALADPWERTPRTRLPAA